MATQHHSQHPLLLHAAALTTSPCGHRFPTLTLKGERATLRVKSNAVIVWWVIIDCCILLLWFFTVYFSPAAPWGSDIGHRQHYTGSRINHRPSLLSRCWSSFLRAQATGSQRMHGAKEGRQWVLPAEQSGSRIPVLLWGAGTNLQTWWEIPSLDGQSKPHHRGQILWLHQQREAEACRAVLLGGKAAPNFLAKSTWPHPARQITNQCCAIRHLCSHTEARRALCTITLTAAGCQVAASWRLPCLCHDIKSICNEPAPSVHTLSVIPRRQVCC